MARPEAAPSVETPYLAICGWDIPRWKNSRAYRRMSLSGQGAYLNLCFSAWESQPACVLQDDDRELWRLANAPTPEAWLEVKAEVLCLSDAWSYTSQGWLQEVVLETFQDAVQRHAAAVRSGRIAGKASGRARRLKAQAARIKDDGTTVQRPFNDRSTTVEPALTKLVERNRTRGRGRGRGIKNPPIPPATAGWHGPPVNGGRPDLRAERKATRQRVDDQVAQARDFAISQGMQLARRDLRLFREWFNGGLTLGEVQARIEQGAHRWKEYGDGTVSQPRPQLPKHLGAAEMDLIDEAARPPTPATPEEAREKALSVLGPPSDFDLLSFDDAPAEEAQPPPGDRDKA